LRKNIAKAEGRKSVVGIEQTISWITNGCHRFGLHNLWPHHKTARQSTQERTPWLVATPFSCMAPPSHSMLVREVVPLQREMCLCWVTWLLIGPICPYAWLQLVPLGTLKTQPISFPPFNQFTQSHKVLSNISF
jgi:hypothetical protein